MPNNYRHWIFGYPLYLLVLDDKVIGCSFSEKKHLQSLRALSCEPPKGDHGCGPLPARFQRPLTNYLSGKSSGLEWPEGDYLLRKGSPFQRATWRHIAAIPYGETCCYGEIALHLGGGKYTRAVGGACNANPLALLVPCHRVVARKGLGGFAADTAIKEKLLQLETRTLRAGS